MTTGLASKAGPQPLKLSPTLYSQRNDAHKLMNKELSRELFELFRIDRLSGGTSSVRGVAHIIPTPATSTFSLVDTIGERQTTMNSPMAKNQMKLATGEHIVCLGGIELPVKAECCTPQDVCPKEQLRRNDMGTEDDGIGERDDDIIIRDKSSRKSSRNDASKQQQDDEDDDGVLPDMTGRIITVSDVVEDFDEPHFKSKQQRQRSSRRNEKASHKRDKKTKNDARRQMSTADLQEGQLPDFTGMCIEVCPTDDQLIPSTPKRAAASMVETDLDSLINEEKSTIMSVSANRRAGGRSNRGVNNLGGSMNSSSFGGSVPLPVRSSLHSSFLTSFSGTNNPSMRSLYSIGNMSLGDNNGMAPPPLPPLERIQSGHVYVEDEVQCDKRLFSLFDQSTSGKARNGSNRTLLTASTTRPSQRTILSALEGVEELSLCSEERYSTPSHRQTKEVDFVVSCKSTTESLSIERSTGSRLSQRQNYLSKSCND